MKEEIEIIQSLSKKVASFPFTARTFNFGQVVEFYHLTFIKVNLASTDTKHIVLHEVFLRSVRRVLLIYIITGCFLDNLGVVDVDKAVIGFFSKNTDQVVEAVGDDFEVCEIRAGKSYPVVDYLEELKFWWCIFVKDLEEEAEVEVGICLDLQVGGFCADSVCIN